MKYILILALMFAPMSLSAHTSDEFPDLVDNTKEAVVFVINTVNAEADMGKDAPAPFTNPDELPQIDPDSGPPLNKYTGTGFLVEGGYIITNWHVIQNSEKLEVYFENSRRPYDVTLVAFDEAVDIAILKVGDDFPTDVTPLQWRQTPLRVGEDIWAVGHPMGLTYSVTKGIISNLDRRIASPWQQMIQIDAAINSGNSGGPLLDMDGRVIGVNVMIIQPGGSPGFAGVAMAIDHNTAQDTIKTLLADGEIERPLMGVILGYDPESLKVQAYEVSEDGAAKSAGVMKGDLYIEIDNHVITSINDVFDILGKRKPQDVITVKVLRDGALVFISVKLGSLPG